MATRTPRPPRRRGRPPAAKSGEQRQRLLDAALDLFGERGIAATPLNAIARRAHVTPALLHYYFDSRDALIGAVVQERLQPLVERVAGTLGEIDSADPREALRRLAAGILATVSATPWLPPLWVREILAEEGLLREHLLARIAPGIALRLRELVQRGQAAGLLNPGLDPRLLLVSLVGLTIFALAAAPVWRRLPDSADIDTETLSRHVLALLGSGLEPPHASN
ncbi:hypothetical protein ASG87_17725 [Frateuria sp. Soil773]|uniref:TetR/AcrR family transcriptional regulator n=1 Tax=Frateuria sp. Soil773 TaxID=1736407 RepID=UPI0006F51BE9|nr:TetR/AcrR family transcriptional regulator [Frateuria sp. Soil773]KRE94443.1 hypothetical protein ASG87_17725 [Frateuria sp. Soil773]